MVTNLGMAGDDDRDD